jgi:CheY-like chemotaxis protein
MTHVLLVEDDAWLADVESGALRSAGFDVRVAPNALAAIDIVDTMQPDAIVLDVLLAGSTGFALLNELQSYSDTATIPVILCTSIAEQLNAVQLKQYGVHRILDKTTMVPDDIVAAVRSAL